MIHSPSNRRILCKRISAYITCETLKYPRRDQTIKVASMDATIVVEIYEVNLTRNRPPSLSVLIPVELHVVEDDAPMEPWLKLLKVVGSGDE